MRHISELLTILLCAAVLSCSKPEYLQAIQVQSSAVDQHSGEDATNIILEININDKLIAKPYNQAIVLSPLNKLNITLAYNPSTGYRWELKNEDQLYKYFTSIDSKVLHSPHANHMVGEPSPLMYTFVVATKPQVGHDFIILEQYAPGNLKPVLQIKIKIIIT